MLNLTIPSYIVKRENELLRKESIRKNIQLDNREASRRVVTAEHKSK